MRGRLSTEQRAILFAVRRITQEHGAPPTASLIVDAVPSADLTKSLPRLLADGWLEFTQCGRSTRIALAPGRR